MQDESRSAWPECEEFFNLCQHYRHAPIDDIEEVVANYEALKAWIREHAIPRDGAEVPDE